jgi:adenine/guanine phosphoribosyltransferase-like PRPP-binding protein
MERDLIPKAAPVVVVDDVLSMGETRCAALELFVEAGVSVDNISVMVMAEFPLHRGRGLLY